MAMNTIITKLGLDGTAFRRGLVTAEKDLNRIQGRLSRFGFGAIGFALVGSLFREMLNDARNAEGQLDKTQQALVGLGEGLDALRNGAKSALGAIVAGATQAIQATTNWTASLVLGREEVQRRIAESERALQIERDIAEWTKKSEDIARRRADAEKQIAGVRQQSAEFALSQLTLEEQLESRAKDQQAALDALLQTRKNSAEEAEALLLLERASLARARAQVAVDRELSAARAKAAKDQEDAQKKLQARRESLAQAQRDFEAEQLRRQDRILAIEQERNAINATIARNKGEQLDKEERLLNLSRELFRLKRDQNTEEERAQQAIADAQERLSKAERDLRDARAASAQGSFSEVLSGQRGTGADQANAQRIQREQERRQRLVDQLARQRQGGASQEQQDRVAQQIRDSFEREQALRERFSVAVRDDAKAMFEEQKKAVDEARKQVDAAQKMIDELKLVREAIKEL